MSNIVRALEDKDFELQNINPKIIGGRDVGVLFIKAEWCGYCTQYIPTFEQYSSQQKDTAAFLTLETTKNEKKLEQWRNLQSPAFDIQGFPTLVLYSSSGFPIKVVNDRFNLEQEITDIVRNHK